MKTDGMKHQLEALRRMDGVEAYALLMEQGTGKTWTLLADAERNYRAGRIDALLVFAPKGVHTNWVRREIPEHLGVPHIAEAWRASPGKKAMARLERLLKPTPEDEVPPLRVLAVNYEAMLSEQGRAFVYKFLRATRAMVVCDESQRIKSPDGRTHKEVVRLRRMRLAALRRIATGTPLQNGPLDAFGQFEFLDDGLLGTTSHRAFVAEYADLIPSDHPMMARLAQRNPKAARAQIVARNPDGSPRYRNLDKLQTRIERHSFRVLKRDCLDLPEKIYQTRYFELPPKLRAAYELMEDELRIQLEDGTIETVHALSALIRLQQITSGFVTLPDREKPMLIDAKDNPRLSLLMDVVEDIDGKFIVWAHFREELRQIAEAFAAAGIEAVEYHGGVGTADREDAIERFQKGTARAFLGQAQAGGTGLTLTAAETTVYYSNSFNNGVRQQSEDRNHRIGTKRNVVYIDLAATDTIDESISRALQRKTSIAAAVLDGRNLRMPAAAGFDAVDVLDEAPAARRAARVIDLDEVAGAFSAGAVLPMSREAVEFVENPTRRTKKGN